MARAPNQNQRIVGNEGAKVLVVLGAPNVRKMLREVLEELECHDVLEAAHLEEAVKIMELYEVDWVVTTAHCSETYNVFHLLKYLIEHPRHRHVEVSLFVNPDDELYLLPRAFELGLLSWHCLSNNRDDIAQELVKFLSTKSFLRYQSARIAADYAREALLSLGLRESRFTLERSLLKLFPGDPRSLIFMGEAAAELGEVRRAELALREAEVLDPKFSGDCDCLRVKHGLKPGYTKYLRAGDNSLGLDVALVVDSDTQQLNWMSELLTSLGVPTVLSFEDTQRALQYLAEHQTKPSVVIVAWNIKPAGGGVFLQKLQQVVAHHCPVLVLGDKLNRGEVGLLRELGIDEVLQKPYVRQDVTSRLVRVLQSHRFPTEQHTLKSRIIALLGAGDLTAARGHMERLDGEPTVNAALRLEIRAHHDFAVHDYHHAYYHATAAVQAGGDNLMMFQVMGRALIEQKQFASALKALEKAHSLCSLNLTRILLLAEASFVSGNIADAKKYVTLLRLLDPDNNDALPLQGSILLADGALSSARDFLARIPSGRDFVQFIHHKVTGLLNAGHHQEAIQLQTRLLRAMPSAWVAHEASVRYQLGVSHAKFGNNAEAMAAVEAIRTPYHELLWLKIRSLKARLKQCIAAGVRLEFHQEELEAPSPQLLSARSNGNAMPQPLMALDQPTSIFAKDSPKSRERGETAPGDMGLFLLYQTVEPHDPRISRLEHGSIVVADEDSLSKLA